MTSPVIEAMAKAIYDTAIDRRPLTPLGMCVDYPEWDDLSDSDREHARAEAIACLKALEENITDEMLEAANHADALSESGDHYGDIFTAMLRAARGEWGMDKGPWHAKIGAKIFVESDDFTHDVRLYISGDFKDDAQRMEYARFIADRLNGLPTNTG